VHKKEEHIIHEYYKIASFTRKERFCWKI